MRKRIYSWGKSDNGSKRHFLTFELNVSDRQVEVRVISEDAMTQAVEDQITQKWKTGQDMDWPEVTQTYKVPLSVSDTFVPDGFLLDNDDLVRQARIDWNYIVVSNHAKEVYQMELEDIKERVDRMTDYTSDVWDDLKNYWSKVNEQIRDRTLMREHSREIKDTVDQLFAALKEKRATVERAFRAQSKASKDQLSAKLEEIEKKIEEGMSFQAVFDRLRNLQNELKKETLTGRDRQDIWKRVDAAFKVIKEKRSSSPGQQGHHPGGRIQSRIEGLEGAIERMTRSVKRDENELNFQKDRINKAHGQLEQQMRQAKLAMVEERFRSKKAKLDDMLKTKEQLLKKLEKEVERQKRRAEELDIKKKAAEAKAEIKDKIAQEAKEAAQSTTDELDKLLHAAEAINQSRPSKTTAKTGARESTQAEEDIGASDNSSNQAEHTANTAGRADEEQGDGELRLDEFIQDQIEDMVDTAKAVASVLVDRVTEIVEHLTEEE